MRKSKADPRKTSDDLQRDLEEADVHISSSTGRRSLIEQGRFAKKAIKNSFSHLARKKSDYNEQKDTRIGNTKTGVKSFFSDESHFFVQGHNPQFVRRSQGEPLRQEHIFQSMKHPHKKMFWGCFSAEGTGALVPIDGMMNSQTNLPILDRRVTQELEKIGQNAIFQQDSAPCHKAKIVTKFFE